MNDKKCTLFSLNKITEFPLYHLTCLTGYDTLYFLEENTRYIFYINWEEENTSYWHSSKLTRKRTECQKWLEEIISGVEEIESKNIEQLNTIITNAFAESGKETTKEILWSNEKRLECMQKKPTP